jgi:predicted site-specific integrase-resolvase
MNQPKLIPLSAWAAILFGQHAPHRNTLLRWTHEGKIYPMPKKIGKAWFVSPLAEYSK